MLPAEVFATLFAVLMLPVCFMMSPGGGGGAAAEGGGAAAEDDDKEPWEKNPRYLTRTNWCLIRAGVLYVPTAVLRLGSFTSLVRASLWRAMLAYDV
jgi:hypothetical protein